MVKEKTDVEARQSAWATGPPYEFKATGLPYEFRATGPPCKFIGYLSFDFTVHPKSKKTTIACKATKAGQEKYNL